MGSDLVSPRRTTYLAGIAAREHARLAGGGAAGDAAGSAAGGGERPALPIDIEALTRWHGLVVRRVEGDLYAQIERTNLDGTPLSGMFDFMNGEILVRADQPATRQRFTIAHELAHYLIDDHASLYGGTVRYTVDVEGRPRSVDLAGQPAERRALIDRAEAEADALAGMLLMPADLVDAAVAELGPSVALLAGRFGVSAGAMRRNMATYLPTLETV